MRHSSSLAPFAGRFPGALVTFVAGALVLSCGRPPEGAAATTGGTVADGSTAMTKPTFDCEIRVTGAPPAGGPVALQFRLHLRSGPPVHVLSWRTPLEGLRGNDFRVEREGVEIPYRGPMVKRGNPNAKSYLLLEPGKDLEAEVDLALAYDFTKPGRYRITLTSGLMDVVTDPAQVPRTLDQLEGQELRCAPIDVTVGPTR